MRIGLFSGLSLLILACGTSSESDSQNVTKDQPTEPQLGDPPAATGESDAFRPSSTNEDAGPRAQDGTAPSDQDSRILPLAVGRLWTYDGVQTTRGRSSAMHIEMRVLSEGLQAGRTAFSISNNGTTPTWTALDGNDDVLQKSALDAGWYPYVKGPIAEGKTWTYAYAGTRKQTWHNEGSVYVPAGTFTDCWRVDIFIAESMKPGDMNFQVYCRGVGLVRNVIRMGGSEYGLDYELTAKNF